MISSDVYIEVVIKEIPKLLGLLDKNITSSTHGCFDREFWHYATSDTPSARKQEAVLTLALLFKLKHSKNPYFKSERVLEFIKAGLNYWTKIQEKNGSFNEWYPKENSFVATSFTLYAMTETLILLNIDDPKIKNSISKAAHWLINKKEERAMNQEAGSALALYNSYLITGDETFKIVSENKINNIYKKQDKEGWFIEYGGADIGYLSLAVDYLGKLYQKTNNKKLLDVLKKSCDFLSYFIHPDFTFGGVYGSRNTEYLIPHGFEIIADKDKSALLLTSAIRESLKKQTYFPNSLDERYLSQILYTWIQAHMDSKNKYSKDWLFKKNFNKDFENAGIYIFSNKNFYFVVNYKKSGVFKLYLKQKKKQVVDSGIFLKIRKKRFQSAWFGNSKFEIKNNRIKVSGNFVKYKSNKTSPFKYFLIRLFQYTFGRIEKIGLFVKNKLRDFLITKNKKERHWFERIIEFKNSKIVIIDTLKIGEIPYFIYYGGKIENIYVPSSNYFSISDLDTIFSHKKSNSPKISFKRDFL